MVSASLPGFLKLACSGIWGLCDTEDCGSDAPFLPANHEVWTN